MKGLLLKIAKAFTPEKFKVWFPAVGKLGILVGGFLTVLGRPESAQDVVDFASRVFSDDPEYAVIVAAVFGGAIKMVVELANDVQEARGKPPVTGPVVKTIFGHDVYSDEFQKEFAKSRDYVSSVKKATARAQVFERVLSEEWKKLQNDGGMPSDEAFIRARNIAKAKSEFVTARIDRA